MFSCQITLRGHLDKQWMAWFAPLHLAHTHDGCTTLNGFVADQAELHGLLKKLRDLGASLISLKAELT